MRVARPCVVSVGGVMCNRLLIKCRNILYGTQIEFDGQKPTNVISRHSVFPGAKENCPKPLPTEHRAIEY